jgi:hypothetical protein
MVISKNKTLILKQAGFNSKIMAGQNFSACFANLA